MRNSRSSKAVAFVLMLSPLQAAAQDGWRDVYACGGSKGHSYFMNGEGWQEDGISQGVIVLKRQGSEFDVQHADATGTSFSARGDGATVVGREVDGVVQVVVAYPGMTIETYLFSKPENGRSTLAWTSSKQVSGIADRASVFVSSCLVR